MNTKSILATVLAILAFTTVLAGVRDEPVPVGFQVSGDQLTVTLANSGSSAATISLTAFQFGESLGTVSVTVPAESFSTAVFTITDEINPFGFSFAVAT